MVRYRCAICGRVFELSADRPALPAHVYPSGLRRGQRCLCTYGVRAEPSPATAAARPSLAL
jgi:hypothetical protein